ncbi:YuzD family protein [Halalkalibacter akibai]|uniref:YuzD-like protein n=1 Tax=Halalkalibacter akibai (strain ATCC 43226 / DSM 21942 / CIP 109018 / JCM 9157 / 1139) TaxID=1236973 RepID=W4QMY6_HALA3|nr:YuzD family protein [Halalkalibacter akibai]GAE33282.1 YuzD-like protein [Halalkalibacter akibai JCM 9157]
MKITVYGAEQKCASCIHLPSAKETMEWLEAAITRKYPEVEFDFEYVDIDEPGPDQTHIEFADAIKDDEYFYPLVVLENEVVAEGNPKLKEIYEKIEQLS